MEFFYIYMEVNSMANSKRGLRVGHYRITPLGLGVICGLIVIIGVVIALFVANQNAPLDGQNNAFTPGKAAPTATATIEPEISATPEVTVTSTPEPTATPKPEPRSATIRMLGEITMENDLLKSAYNSEDQTFDFSPMFSEISEVVGNADYTIADVEGVMGDEKQASGTPEKMLTPSSLLTALKSAGVDMLMMSNDHVLDGGFALQQAALQNVAQAGLDYVGAAASEEEKNTPVVKDINGIKVGFVACESLNVKEKSLEKEALTYGVNLVSRSNAPADIQALRSAGAEVVIALINWGKEYETSPSASQGKIAEVLVASGADVILGYNPRVLQPAKWLEGTVNGAPHRTLCLCAPGNFLSGKRENGFNCGAIFEITLTEQPDGTIAVESPKYIPTYVLRYAGENDLYEYRTIAVGQWTDENADNMPEGMTYADLQYMGTLWTAVQKLMGEDVVAIARD